MNGAPAIYVLLLYLFAALVPASVKTELGKLDQLLAHYLDHRSETPELSFAGFLKMHYGKAYQGHRSVHDHGNLPGKGAPEHTHLIACGCSPLALPASLVMEFRPPLSPSKRRLVPSEESLIFSVFASGIWQPPRLG